MITRHVLTLQAKTEHPLHADAAYRLYAFLLEQLPPEEAQWLHDTASQLVSQFLCFRRETQTYAWTVNLLSEEAAAVLDPVLSTCQAVQIENEIFPVLERSSETVTLDQLLEQGRGPVANRCRISFLTPAAFKQNGRYTFFPQERLILQSLMMRWNAAFPMCPLEDADAFHALLAGIRMTDYRLRSTRFSMKGVWIPGFVGTCDLESRLAVPLQELWNTLMAFAGYAGIGIKTGLGMGGTEVTMK